MFSHLSFSDIIAILISLLISLSFHEAMHAFVAHALGDDTAQREGRLTLNPIKHIDLYTTILLPAVMLFAGFPPILAARPVPFNPARVKFEEYGAALVGVAGPLSNLLLAVIVSIAFRSGIVGSGAAVHYLGLFLTINVGLFVFNMIPIPPLDGSRLVYAFAPEPVREVMSKIESMGFLLILGILIVLLPVLGPVITNVDASIVNFLLS